MYFSTSIVLQYSDGFLIFSTVFLMVSVALCSHLLFTRRSCVLNSLGKIHCNGSCFLIVQANEILSSFDDRLRIYATKQLTKVKHLLKQYIAHVVQLYFLRMFCVYFDVVYY